jgi:hypothetical protein
MRSSWEGERVDGSMPLLRRRERRPRVWVWVWSVVVDWAGGGGATWDEWW